VIDDEDNKDEEIRPLADDAPEQEIIPPQKAIPSAASHRSSLRKFSKRMVADFANSWLIHGEEAIEKLRKENIQAYVKTAVSLIPREILLSVSNKAANEMSDRELLQAAAAEKEQATLLIDHIRLMGPEEETILLQAQREVLGAALNPDDADEDDDDNG
jgi:hypothetical protein